MQLSATYPLTKPQTGIFLHCLRNPDSTQYNLPVLVEIPFGVDAEMICKALTERLNSLSAVFTRFSMSPDGIPMQYYAKHKPVRVKQLEMSEKDFALYKKQGMIRPFNLFDDEPLARIALCTTEKSRYLITDIHHIICDGWALHILFDLNAELHDLPDFEQKNSAKGKDSRNATRERFAEVSFADISRQTGKRAGRQVRCSERMEEIAVDRWCEENGTTANGFFMAAFCVVMSRLTRLNEMGFYTMSHGRSDKRTRNSLGMFVRSVPMLAEINWNSNCLSLMEALRKEHISALRNSGDYTMTDLCEERGMVPAIYFNFLGWERMRECLFLENGVVIPAEQPCRPSVDDNLGVEIYLNGEDYEIRCQSSEAVNPEPVVRQVAESMRLVAEWMMSHATEPLKDISLINDEEKSSLMELGQGETMDFNPEDTFLTLFQKQVAKTPDAIAIVDAERQLTYAELQKESAGIAEQFKAEGIKEGFCINVPLERNATFLASIIAAEMIGATVSLSHSSTLPDQEEKMLGSKNIAYIIYTSGSTGKPKGVMISHKAKANLVQFIAKEWNLSEKSRICCHSDLAFDASVEDLFPVLTVGGTLYIMPEEIRRDIDKIHDFIVTNRITGGCFTTQLGQMLLQRFPDLPMEYLVVGGEKMTIIPDCHCKLINTYGPTEFTVDATYHVIDKKRNYETIPIGRPIANTSAFILDDCLQLLPKGMTGELCLSGIQMADGYYGDTELTNRKFVFSPIGQKVYRTGDLARWNENGELEYLGRTDSQLKIRGFRVEPAEIEARIAEHPKVLMQVVIPFTAAGDKHLCAYYVADGKISTEEMKEYLSDILSDYMIPDAYIQLEKIPLTQSGKVDVRRLPMPRLSGSSEYIEPEDGLERILANAMGKTLGIERVSASDDFFNIGGTSLNAIGVVLEAERHGLRIALNDIFKYKTPRAIALNFEERKKKGLLQTEKDNKEIKQEEKSCYKKQKFANSQPFITHNNILLLGATGFLGIHILHELLSDSAKHIFCPIRRKNDCQDEKERLNSTYKFYFDKDINFEEFKERLTIVSNKNWQTNSIIPDNVTVINCIGNVKHFAADSSIMDTNVETVRQIVDFCVRKNRNLVHISTKSISGIANKEKINNGLLLTEQDYDIGQNIEFNEYIKSKFMAEGLILDAIKAKRLNTRIMRVGNLSARSYDGKFQANPESNAFYSAQEAIKEIGYIPESMKDYSFDISPIDITAKAIIKLITLSNENIIYHPYNNKLKTLNDLVTELNKSGYNIRFIEDSKFNEIIEKAKQNPALIEKLHYLLAYQLPDSNLKQVPTNNQYTYELLKGE